MDAVILLDQLAEFQAQRDYLNLKRIELIDAVMTPEIKNAINEIEAEFAEKAAGVDENIATLKARIEAAILEKGETVKGSSMMAIWNKGRTTWDSKKLEGMSLLIPELDKARKVGEPTVSFKAVTK